MGFRDVFCRTLSSLDVYNGHASCAPSEALAALDYRVYTPVVQSAHLWMPVSGVHWVRDALESCC